jgi:hypothetical protein
MGRDDRMLIVRPFFFARMCWKSPLRPVRLYFAWSGRRKTARLKIIQARRFGRVLQVL